MPYRLLNNTLGGKCISDRPKHHSVYLWPMELKLEAIICIQALAICFGRSNKGVSFVYYCSFKAMFCEDE